MSPHRLALRTLMLARPRSVLAMLLMAACLSLLALFAGHIASVRARLEYQAVIGERLGHLTITRAGAASGAAFAPAEAQQVKRLAEALAGVAQVVPQMSVNGIASTGQGSALFRGEGVSAGGGLADPHGRLNPARPNGIALSSGNARSLGLQAGSNVTLTGISADKAAAPRRADVADVFSTAQFNDDARSLLMPFAMAQSLLDTELTERLVVYLDQPGRLDGVQAALRDKLRQAGLAVDVRSWRELSATYLKVRNDTAQRFDSVAAMAFAVIAAAICATISIDAHERRREVATLRAFGMRRRGVVWMFAAEALWMAAFAVLLSAIASGLIAWVVNRAALSYTTQQALKGAPMLVELDFHQMLMATAVVMAVALLAALAPALKAARLAVAEGLAA